MGGRLNKKKKKKTERKKEKKSVGKGKGEKGDEQRATRNKKESEK